MNIDRASEDGVSIIVPCYNDGRFLEEAITSVYAQFSSIPFEIIMIDDASSCPETLAIITELKDKYSDQGLRVFYNQENVGVSVTRNRALNEAYYEYIFPLDADNKLGVNKNLEENWYSYFEQGFKILRDQPDVVMVYNDGRVFGDRQGPWNLKPYNEKMLLTRNMLDAHAMYRRSEALAVGGYVDNRVLSEDWVLAVALHNQRLKQDQQAQVHMIHGPYFYYRVRSDGQNRTACEMSTDLNVTRLHMIRQYPEIYNKHFPAKNEKAQLRSVDWCEFWDRNKDTTARKKFYRVARKLCKPLANKVFAKPNHELEAEQHVIPAPEKKQTGFLQREVGPEDLYYK